MSNKLYGFKSLQYVALGALAFSTSLFAAETTAAVIIQAASYYGIPLSTTHVISTSIMGVGAVKRFSGMRWVVVERIIWTWLFTLPASGLIGYALARAAAAL